MFKIILSTTWLMLVFILVSSPLSAQRKKGSPMPPFQVGITGIYAVPSSPEWEEVIVTGIEKDSFAFGKIQKDDVIVSAGGLKLASPDPRVMLGNAITQAESKDGKMKLTVRRSGKEVDVILNLEVMGPYSKTWPLNCDKTNKIVDAAISDTIKRIDKGDLEFGNREGSMAALFLLSTGKPEHVEVARKYVGVYLDAFNGETSSHTWNNGFLSLALGEYYLRTGDKRTLKPIQALVDNSYGRMTCGGWGHWNYPNAGYVRSGLVNAAGGPLFIGMVLARECGVKMNEEDFKTNLKYFYRFAGYGGVPYGDHHPGGGPATNGKSGMACVGYSLIPEAPYQAAAQQYAVEQADSYKGFEGGHTGNMTNVMWRGLASVHVPDYMQHHYRKHMDELRWYYELCRDPIGGFRMLPTKKGEGRYSAKEWGMCIALTYTAAWKKLRITGAAPTKFSIIKPVGIVTEKHLKFVTPIHAEGYKDSDFEPIDVIAGKLKWDARRAFYKSRKKPGDPLKQINPDDELPSIEYLAKHFRHYNSVARRQAGNAIGYHGDKALPEVIKALKSKDPRVRRAGLNAVCGLHTFFLKKSPFTYSAEGINSLVPYVVRILEDSKSDMWEYQGALWAMSSVDPKIIAKNLPLIGKFLTHDEWWVRVAAFAAVTGAKSELNENHVLALFQTFVHASHSNTGRDYEKRLGELISQNIVKLSDDARKKAVMLLAGRIKDSSNREKGYVLRGNGFYDTRTINFLRHTFKPDEIAYAADAVNLFLARIGDPLFKSEESNNYQQYAWILCGFKDEASLIDKINQMTPQNRAKFMPGFKALLLGGLDYRYGPKTKGSKNHGESISSLKNEIEKTLSDYEMKNGKVNARSIKE